MDSIERIIENTLVLGRIAPKQELDDAEEFYISTWIECFETDWEEMYLFLTEVSFARGIIRLFPNHRFFGWGNSAYILPKISDSECRDCKISSQVL